MSDQNEFDFIKAFADVDVLKATAMGEVVGQVIGSVYKGLIASLGDEQLATKVMHIILREAMRSIMSYGGPSK